MYKLKFDERLKEEIQKAAWEEVYGFDEHEVKNYGRMTGHFYTPLGLTNRFRSNPVSDESVWSSAREKMLVLKSYDEIVDDQNLTVKQRLKDPRVKTEILAHANKEASTFGIDNDYALHKVNWYMGHHEWIVEQVKNNGHLAYPRLDSKANYWMDELAKSESKLASSLTKEEIGGLLYTNYLACIILHDGHRMKGLERHDETNKRLMARQYASYLEILISNMGD